MKVDTKVYWSSDHKDYYGVINKESSSPSVEVKVLYINGSKVESHVVHLVQKDMLNIC